MLPSSTVIKSSNERTLRTAYLLQAVAHLPWLDLRHSLHLPVLHLCKNYHTTSPVISNLTQQLHDFQVAVLRSHEQRR